MKVILSLPVKALVRASGWPKPTLTVKFLPSTSLSPSSFTTVNASAPTGIVTDASADRYLFNDNWCFLKTELGTELPDIRGREEQFAPVDIPHDWLIYNPRDLYEDSTGWYRKPIFVNRMENTGSIRDGWLCCPPGQRVILRFDRYLSAFIALSPSGSAPPFVPEHAL